MKVMRLRHAKLIVAIVAVVNVLLVYYVWKSTFWKNLANSLTAGNGVEPLENPNDDLTYNSAKALKKDKEGQNANKHPHHHIRKSMTIIFRTFYSFENDLKDSIDSLLNVMPNLQILIMQDGLPYPPIDYERNVSGSEQDQTSTVRFINLAFDIEKPLEELHPLDIIKTKYVLFMPDSVRLSNKNLLQKILKEINGQGISAHHSGHSPLHNSKNSQNSHSPPTSGGGVGGGGAVGVGSGNDIVRRIIIVPFAGSIKSFSSCAHINLDLPNWTIQYVATNSSEKCDLYLQKHAILVDVGTLKEMPDAFAAPFPEMFYIQSKVAKLKTFVYPQSFQNGRTLFASYHTKQRRLEIRRREFKKMYKELQIKRIIRRAHKINTKTESKDAADAPQHNLVLDTQFSSSNFSLPQVTEIDLIGCERMTKSCIGTVHDNRPFYVYVGKHTPPCCLDKLKSTFNHVLEEFENVGIRYWLDNQALRTAIETNQLSPNAFDIDISFNVNDLERSNSLKKSQNKPFIDNDGFYWIKATDGHYFHVQFSKINQIGVNLLPFEINGNEVSPSGFFGKKAKIFSADFLHPMSTVLLLGKKIMCPNNVGEFLEIKNRT